MAETFLALLTAHLLGDFVFQTNWMVKNKKKILVLLLHVATISVTSLAILRSFHWGILVTVFVSYLFSDLLKTKVNKDSTGPFLIDQIAHISVAAILAVAYPDAAANGWWPVSIQEWLPWYHSGLCLLSGVILIVPAGGILIGKLTEPIRQEIKESKIIIDATDQHSPGDYLTEGLSNGGRYIGWLERFLTMLLILIAQPTGIGFLIAAKSILRFGEIKESKHRKLAEYIIIGTFLSFGWALFISVLMQKGIDHWTPKDGPKPLRVVLEPLPTTPVPTTPVPTTPVPTTPVPTTTVPATTAPATTAPTTTAPTTTAPTTTAPTTTAPTTTAPATTAPTVPVPTTTVPATTPAPISKPK